MDWEGLRAGYEPAEVVVMSCLLVVVYRVVHLYCVGIEVVEV